MNKRTPTKQNPLHILKKEKEVTIDGIMEYFTITEVAVRKPSIIHTCITEGAIM